jgi:hypothetical protein
MLNLTSVRKLPLVSNQAGYKPQKMKKAIFFCLLQGLFHLSGDTLYNKYVSQEHRK